jgi:tetratricopeptide (TPR) repeat protein
LVQISTHISSEDSRRLAIYGLGGCGKTALALETAYRTQQQQPDRAIFWVPAVSQSSFEQAYQEIGLLLRIPGIADAQADVKQLVKAKLSDERFGQWLLIVDNADDVSILFGSSSEGKVTERLIDYLPQSRKGSVIFTTRTTKAAIELAGSNVIELGQLDATDAKELARTRLLLKHQHQVEDVTVVSEFLSMLAFFALAIVQAVAFINKNDCKLSDYISLYRASEQQATKLLSKEFQDSGRYRETKNPVATTWYISFERINQDDKLAADYLSFMACTTNSDIPATMLRTEGNEVEHTEALGTLKAYAFITERQPQRRENRDQQESTQKPTETYDVHPLVHLAMRNWLKAHNQWLDWTAKTTTRLLELIPRDGYNVTDVWSTREVWAAYIPHAMHVVDISEVCEEDSRIRLLKRIGWYADELGWYSAGAQAYRQLLGRQQIVFGKEHPETLVCMNNLAIVLKAQGKHAEAEPLFQETLAIREKVLGKEHPETLLSTIGLAALLRRQGKYVEAEQMLRETLVLQEKVLGKEHPETMATMSGLAKTLRRQGKYAEAEQMLQEALALRLKVLGKEHPETLANTSILASLLRRQGRHAEADQMLQETLALREKVLGKEHPETLNSMKNIAGILSRQGKYAEAEHMLQETLALQEKVLGKEHPETLNSMYNLALVYDHQGRRKDSKEMQVQVLELRTRSLGKENMQTLDSMHRLALTYLEEGQWKEAEELEVQVLEMRMRKLGKEHLDTIRTMGNLGLIYSRIGRWKEAEELEMKVWELRKSKLGEQHEDTLASIGNLGLMYSEQGRWKEAEELEIQALEISRRVLGEEHVDTLTCMNNLAYTQRCQGRYEEAISLMKKCYDLRKQGIGPDNLMRDSLKTLDKWKQEELRGRHQSSHASAIPRKRGLDDTDTTADEDEVGLGTRAKVAKCPP